MIRKRLVHKNELLFFGLTHGIEFKSDHMPVKYPCMIVVCNESEQSTFEFIYPEDIHFPKERRGIIE